VESPTTRSLGKVEQLFLLFYFPCKFELISKFNPAIHLFYPLLSTPTIIPLFTDLLQSLPCKADYATLLNVELGASYWKTEFLHAGSCPPLPTMPLISLSDCPFSLLKLYTQASQHMKLLLLSDTYSLYHVSPF
jgi:hypothetical protein